MSAMNSFPVDPPSEDGVKFSGPARPSKHRTLRPTILDFAVIAIAPTLITILLWSLVIATMTVLSHFGNVYESRLTLAFLCLTMGIVAASRIGMTMGALRAMMYSVVLYLAGMAFMGRFFPQMPIVVQVGIISGIWIAAFLLVYDSTWMPDENDDRDGGILQRVRRRDYVTKLKLGMATHDDDPDRVEGRLAQTDPMDELRKKIPHRPGSVIVWFSLIVLPILGVLQGILPKATVGADGVMSGGGERLTILQCTIVYVIAAMGLLLSTSFIGLRRYLRFRHIDMPPVVVRRWFGFGGVLLFVLAIGTLAIPRPAAEYSLAQAPGVHLEPGEKTESDSPDTEDQRPDASRVSVGQFEPGRDTQDADRAIIDAKGKHVGDEVRSDGSGPPADADGNGKGDAVQEGAEGGGAKNDNTAKNSDPAKNGTESETKTRPKDGNPKGDSSKNSGSPKMETSNDDDPAEKGNSAKNGDFTKNKVSSESKSKIDPKAESKSESPKSESQPKDKSDSKSKASESTSKSEPTPAKSDSSRSSWSFPKISLTGGWVKWALYLLAAVAIIYLLVTNRVALRDGWREFMRELREFFARWFGGRKREQDTPDEAILESSPLTIPYRRLAEFVDPFVSGAVRQWSAPKLLSESFGALQAWGRENGVPRGDEETIHEYATRLASLDHRVGPEAVTLANLYGRTIYFPSSPPAPDQLEPLRQFWVQILR